MVLSIHGNSQIPILSGFDCLYFTTVILVLIKIQWELELSANYQAIIITAILVASMFGYKHFKKKKLSPVLLIVLSAVAGIVIYGI